MSMCSVRIFARASTVASTPGPQGSPENNHSNNTSSVISFFLTATLARPVLKAPHVDSLAVRGLYYRKSHESSNISVGPRRQTARHVAEERYMAIRYGLGRSRNWQRRNSQTYRAYLDVAITIVGVGIKLWRDAKMGDTNLALIKIIDEIIWLRMQQIDKVVPITWPRLCGHELVGGTDA